MYGDFLARNTVCTPYMPINVWFCPTLNTYPGDCYIAAGGLTKIDDDGFTCIDPCPDPSEAAERVLSFAKVGQGTDVCQAERWLGLIDGYADALFPLASSLSQQRKQQTACNPFDSNLLFTMRYLSTSA
jgi:hypothetical protein